MKTRQIFLRIALLAMLSTMPILGQGDRGQITGTVTDSSGAIVPNARVTVVQKNTNTAYKVVSSSAGVFTLPSLAGGDYQVTVEKEGFKNSTVDGVEVPPGGSVGVDIKLEVGATSQTVEVSALTQTIQTENARVS